MKKCENCKVEFKRWQSIKGKMRNLSNRKYCLKCSPFGSHNTKSLTESSKLKESICKNCNTKF